MICKKCGKEIETDSKFCTFCGEKIEEVVQEELTEQPLKIDQTLKAQADEENNVVENVQEEPTEQPKGFDLELEDLPEEDKSNFSSALYTNEFEYTKKIFNQYYKAEFISNSLAGYIVLQILLTNFLFVPGVVFAIIYWCVTNPITKQSQWRNFLFDNNGNQPLYRFFFEENTLVVRRNRVEECTMQYKDFKKIVFTKSGLMFISKKQDFFIPIEEIKNKEEIIEVLSNANNVNFKLKIKK